MGGSSASHATSLATFPHFLIPTADTFNFPPPRFSPATKPSLPAFGGLSTPAATAATPLFNFGAAPVSFGTPGPTPSAAPPIEAHEEEEDVQEEPEVSGQAAC